MTKKKEMQYPLSHQLNSLKTRWLAHANEADSYKTLYEEAHLFVTKAIERLPEDHPLNPLNYQGLFSEEYRDQLIDEFIKLDTESSFDPELDEFVGVEAVPLTDVIDNVADSVANTEEGTFDIAAWNAKVIEEAQTATEGKVLAPAEIRDELQEEGYSPYVLSDTLEEENGEEEIPVAEVAEVGASTDTESNTVDLTGEEETDGTA